MAAPFLAAVVAAAVVCTSGDGGHDELESCDQPPPIAVHSIQLAGCNTDCGRVEIRSAADAQWRYVCSPNWSLKEARVLCKSLGFDEAFGAMPKFGGGSGTPILTFVNCSGDEASITECTLEPVRTGVDASCDPEDAVGISCINAGGLPQDAESVAMRERLDEAANEAVMSWQTRSEDRSQLVNDEWYSQGVGDEETVDCEIHPAVPMPFGQARVSEAYVLADRVYDDFDQMDRSLRQRLCDPLHGADVQQTLTKLVRRGLRWNALGLDLSALQNATPAELALLHELYLSHNKHVEMHWELDQPLRTQPGIPTGDFTPAEIAMYTTLQQDGILPVRDFGLGDAVLEALASTATEAVESTDTNMTSAVSGGDIITARLELPALEPLLTNVSLHRVLQAYLGSEVTLHGYKLTRLDTSTAEDVASYVAARWHHDRAGRRIKLFVYLHDIDCEDGHPTQVAAGTHNLAFYRTEEFPMSRYTDDYIAKEYKIVKGCGQRGGGFLFDTHSVHKGTPYGKQSRTTVIAELHNSIKCPAVKKLGLPIPCPSGDQFMLYRPLPRL